jgi:putative SbcD/Mre11-related phosphoesterase
MQVLTEWWLTPERVAVHVPTGTAVVADLHLGYHEARRRAGEAVPRVPLAEVLEPLGRCLQRLGVRRLAVAGDLLESARCPGVLAGVQTWLEVHDVELTAVVPGNHDAGAELDSLPLFPAGYSLGTWQVVHGDGKLPEGLLVQGHEHPCFVWPDRFGRGEGPCYLVAERRLILPAFSAEAAGVNVVGVRRWRGYRCCVIAGDRVLDLGELGTLRARLGQAKNSGADGQR